MLKASLASKEERWSPPDKNWFKLNSDAAINETEGLARLGVVIRNSREEFTATSICRRPFSGVIEFVEASAVLEGIELVVDLRLTPLMIESDSVNGISLISGRISSNLKINWLIYDIRAFICNKTEQGELVAI